MTNERAERIGAAARELVRYSNGPDVLTYGLWNRIRNLDAGLWNRIRNLEAALAEQTSEPETRGTDDRCRCGHYPCPFPGCLHPNQHVGGGKYVPESVETSEPEPAADNTWLSSAVINSATKRIREKADKLEQRGEHAKAFGLRSADAILLEEIVKR